MHGAHRTSFLGQSAGNASAPRIVPDSYRGSRELGARAGVGRETGSVESGHAASTLGNVADIALRLGRRLKWDPAEDRFDDDDEADTMLARAQRSPWSV